MTIQTLITDTEPYTNTTLIDALILQAFRQISLVLGTTKAEGDDANLDIIAESYTKYLLNRRRLVERALTDPAIDVPPLMPSDIREQLTNMLSAQDPAGLFRLGRAVPAETITDD